MTFPTTNITTQASNPFVSFIQGINTYHMYGQLGNCIIFIIFIVCLGGFIWSIKDFKRSFAASAVISFLFTLMLKAAELVPDFTLYLTLTAAGIGVALAGRRN